MKQPGFFDVDERLARLSGLGDQLEAFSRTVDFEVFRPDLDRALAYGTILNFVRCGDNLLEEEPPHEH
ncbi:transposase [Komagataeibacter medellinensis NBRC 3288]|uniref:Transposase n=1 Tax=Komagataeibacter medellinensis (strain NBRC 3288 / BCRC 11682 / LMG 1693 / Kondo 51) TaxID=634177 RepID=G2I002_KOMMN|nr:transposase [Komagataeibacter medellinensis NBRC 3288]